MNEHVLVNHQDHSNLKVIDGYSPELCDGENTTMVFPMEFRDVQSHYPIFFRKNTETGEFFSVALLGFEQGENLFLSDSGWDANYIPLMVRKQPFFIGLKSKEHSQDSPSMVVTMDPEHRRVSQNEGKSLFNPDGSPTEFLNDKISVLELVHQAHDHAEGFVSALLEYDLIEQFVLEVTKQNMSVNQLLGFYTIKEEAVQALSGDALASLSSRGFLMPMFMVLASHARIRDLIDRKLAQRS